MYPHLLHSSRHDAGSNSSSRSRIRICAFTVCASPFVNRLRRAGVPREAAMRLVNHSSELIHQVYQREKVDDVAAWRDAVEFPE
jgi:hypothetical protein